jgi:sulfite reductase (ferredoxin)
VRLTPYQKVLVLDVADPEPLVRELEALDLRVDASPWRRATMACTGLEYCKLAIVETKARAAELVAELERRLGDQQADITVNLNGCPNACARTQVADIGLKGQLLTGPDGSQVEGFQVHLGGALSLSQEDEAAFGRKPRGVKVLAAELPDFVEGLVRKYRAGRADPSETFTQWVTRIDESQLT